MSLEEELEKLKLDGETIPIWDISDSLLDCRQLLSEEGQLKLDRLHKELHIQSGGPSVILHNRAKEILDNVSKLAVYEIGKS